MPTPRRTPTGQPPELSAAVARFIDRINLEVIGPFNETTQLTVIPFPVDWATARTRSRTTPNPRHPECADLEEKTPCRESWERSLRAIRKQPVVHWHRCPFGQWCALIPAAFKGRCIAAGKLVGYQQSSEDQFADAVDLLDFLTQCFMRREAAWLAELMGEPAPVESEHSPSWPVSTVVVPRPPADSLIGWVLSHIQGNLTKKGSPLTVKAIADHLCVDPAYLSHRFSEQVGVGISWLIAALRLERACELPRSGRVQVKDVAPEVGYQNPEAFAQAFRAHMRMTPTQYRCRAASG